MTFKTAYITFFITISLFSQTNTLEIPLDGDSKWINSLDLKENGYFIKTGKLSAAYSKKLDWKIYYFDKDLNLIYDFPIDKKQIDTRAFSPMMASKSGNFFYHEEFMQTTSFGAGKAHITQIKKDKTVKVLDLSYKDFDGPSNIDKFADESHLNMLAFYKIGKKKKMTFAYKLFRFNHNGFKKTEVTLDLPQVKLPEKKDVVRNTNWEFTEHSEDYIYMSRKQINLESGKLIYYLAVLNKSDGKIINNLQLDYSLKNKHSRPSKNSIEISGVQNFGLNDFKIDWIENVAIEYYTDQAFGNLKLDLDNQRAYIFGLYGDKNISRGTNNGRGCDYQGYYIKSFNLTNGEIIFNINKSLPESLARDTDFKSKGYANQRKLFLDVVNGHVELAISAYKSWKLHNRKVSQSSLVQFSELGEYIKTIVTKPLRKIKTEPPYKVTKSLVCSEGANDFLNTKNPNKDKVYLFTVLNDRDILWEDKNDKMIFYSFLK